MHCLCKDSTFREGIYIDALTAEDAAEEYVAGVDWGGGRKTVWVTVEVTPIDCDEEETQDITVTIPATEPDCHESSWHEWCSPHDLLGGCAENPGVWGHGGGIIMREVCAHCGIYRITDTWARDPETGRLGLESVEYTEADEESLDWVATNKIT